MITGNDIRTTRERLKLSVEELAEIIRVKEDTLYKWEQKGVNQVRSNDPEAYKRLEQWLAGKLENIPRKKIEDAPIEGGYGQPDWKDIHITLLKIQNEVRDQHSRMRDQHNLIDQVFRNQEAMVEILFFVAGRSKSDRNKIIAILKKHGLEGIFENADTGNRARE